MSQSLLQHTFKNRKVLITGHTGFKGSWLTAWLTMLGAKVIGISYNVPTKPSHIETIKIKSKIKNFKVDVKDLKRIKKIFKSENPDFVFHLAAQSLVRQSYEIPVETMMTNAIGSANILDALRFIKKPVTAIMITSDKAYENIELVWGFRENDRLGGKGLPGTLFRKNSTKINNLYAFHQNGMLGLYDVCVSVDILDNEVDLEILSHEARINLLKRMWWKYED